MTILSVHNSKRMSHNPCSFFTGWLPSEPIFSSKIASFSLCISPSSPLKRTHATLICSGPRNRGWLKAKLQSACIKCSGSWCLAVPDLHPVWTQLTSKMDLCSGRFSAFQIHTTLTISWAQGCSDGETSKLKPPTINIAVSAGTISNKIVFKGPCGHT